MTRSNIKTIIFELALQNVNAYTEEWKDYSVEIAEDTAVSYWDNRTEEEVERDEKAGVTFEDYRDWVYEAWSYYQISEQENN